MSKSGSQNLLSVVNSLTSKKLFFYEKNKKFTN